LGLAAHAPIVLDKGSLAGFRDVLQDVDQWCADPERDLRELPRIAGRLPALEDVVIDGHSADVVYKANGEGQEERMEALLSAALQTAIKNNARVDPGEVRARETIEVELELRLRRALRRLLRIRIDYAVEQRKFVLVIRARDQAQERLLAPTRVAPLGTGEPAKEGADLITDLIEFQSQIFENQNRLIELWTEHQALRLALFRDLGMLPCGDWKSFYDQLTARRAEPKT
jgi:hypothetical protein